jgi:hypothetical protein
MTKVSEVELFLYIPRRTEAVEVSFCTITASVLMMGSECPSQHPRCFTAGVC